MIQPPPLILASASPRRRELLERLGLPFQIRPSDIDEQTRPGERPIQTAQRIALAKAEAAASVGDEGIVLGSDTIVVLNGTILGKPKDREDAFRMLRALRGRSHQVITGIALLDTTTGRRYVKAVTTKVWMRPYTNEEIEAYIASGEPFDKAGAYAIQSPHFHPVERIEGCYNNVVGLPLCEVVKGLLKLGYPSSALPLDRLDQICPHGSCQ